MICRLHEEGDKHACVCDSSGRERGRREGERKKGGREREREEGREGGILQ